MVNDPRQTLPAQGLRAYERWRKEVINLTFCLEQSWETLNMEDLSDFVEMVGTLMSFAPVIPDEKIAAREAFEQGVGHTP